MPSPLLLVQALLNRKLVTAEDETGETFHNIAEVEEGGRPARPKARGFLSRYRSQKADSQGEGPSSPNPDREQDFADEDITDEDEDEDEDVIESEGQTPRSEDGVQSPVSRGPAAGDSSSPTSPTLEPSSPMHTMSTPNPQPRRRTIRHHDEENGGVVSGRRNGGGDSSDTTRRDEFSPVERRDTGTSSSTAWSWMTQQRAQGPIRKALKKTKDFIFQTDPTGEKEEGNQFIPNYRYMPILSGVLSPFAILLEIPGLTEHWYIRTENHQVVEVRANPAIIMIAMAVSMACGLSANIALIFRFLERRVKLNTWLAMFFLIAHDIINITVVTTFGVIHRFDDGFTYGEAFWMCVCSTIFSVTVTATLAYDLITTPDFAKSGSGLTRKQRSLVIMVMILLCYIALGSLVFAELIGLTFQDGLYYTVVSIETIGFGDITPTNTASTVFCIFYSTVGIINVGLVVNTTRETIVEAFENAYRKRAAEIARRRHENKVMRVQQRERRIAIEKELHEAGLPLYVRVECGHNVGGGRGYMSTNHHTKLILNEAGLEDWRKKRAEERAKNLADPENAEVQADNVEVPQEELDSDAKKGRAAIAAIELKTEIAMSTDDPGKDQGETYAQFRKRIQKEERREFITKLTVAWTFFITFWLTGAGIFMATEKEWTYGRSLYFCWMSFSTIGYGEIVPKSPAGRAVFVVWALMGVAAMTILIAVLSEAYGSGYKSALQKGSFHKAMKSFEGKEEARMEKSHENLRSPRGSIELGDGHDEDPQHEIELENAKSPSDLAEKILESTRRHLDPIPLNVITHAKTFHDHVRYFANHPQYPHEPPPQSLTDLLDEIAESEKMDERMKQELLSDDEARKALFFMSYERAFRKLIDTAERAVEIIAIKDFEWEKLVEMLREREGRPIDSRQYEAPGMRQQRPDSSQGMTHRKREKRRDPDDETRNEKSGRRSLGQ